MNKRKKIITALLLVLAITGKVYASDLGELISVTDRVVPEGTAGIVRQTVVARVSADGKVALPYYKGSELLSHEAVRGALSETPSLGETGDKKYRILSFKQGDGDVEIILTMKVEGVYELEEADLGDTFPSNAFELKYKAVNSSPLDIGEYIAEVAAPPGYELLNIEDYSAKKPYSIFRDGSYAFGSYNFKGIDAGEQTSLTLNVYRKSSLSAVLIWGLGLILSGLFMFKNRDLLAKAKELKANAARKV